MTTDYSRSMRLAASTATSEPGALRRVIESTVVVVTVDPAAPQAHLTAEVLLSNLRRLPIQLHLAAADGAASLPRDAIERITRRLAEIDPDRPLLTTTPGAGTLHIAIGTTHLTADISAIADGHGVRLRRRGHAFPQMMNPASGLGAVVTAAVLTAEAFKTIVPVAPNRHRLLDRVDFCPVTLGEPETAVSVPALDGAALIGGGAIGTAIALILRALYVRGSLLVVDPETYDEPNVSTYSLGSRDDATAEIDKVELIKRELPQIAVRPLKGTADDLIRVIDNGDEQLPDIVFGAVDSVDARHEIARLHADLALDGSTGGATGTRVGLAEAAAAGPCLRCYYPNTVTGISAEKRLADLTGLPIERVAAGDLLTDQDLVPLSAKQRDLLAPYVKTPICGLARSLGLTGSASDYDPSAAFVAQQAAALVIGAWLRRATAVVPDLRDAEYDALFGPVDGMVQTRRPQAKCGCQRDADLIAQVREARRQ